MPSDSKLKVLVAEDEPAMLNLVARHVRGLGYNVIEASEGDTAWDLAQQHSPDLVILDVMMPGMSGWEICKRLKSPGSSGGQFAGTGVIMLTGIGENLNEMTSSLFAADAWLNKPFDFNELDAKIRETLGRYDDRRLAEREGRVNGVNIVDELDEDDVDDEEDEATEVISRNVPASSPGAIRVRGRSPKAAAVRKPAKAKAAPKKAAPKKAVAKRAAPKKAAKKAAPPKKAAPKKSKARASAKPKKAAAKARSRKPAKTAKKPARRR